MEQRIDQIDIESLLYIAVNHPDLEVSPYGHFIGFGIANKVWHEIIPDKTTLNKN